MEPFSADDLETKDLLQSSAASAAGGSLSVDDNPPPLVTMDNGEIAQGKPLLAPPEKCDNVIDVESTGKNEKYRSSGVWRMVSL